jgi:hypothetical protein
MRLIWGWILDDKIRSRYYSFYEQRCTLLQLTRQLLQPKEMRINVYLLRRNDGDKEVLLFGTTEIALKCLRLSIKYAISSRQRSYCATQVTNIVEQILLSFL